MLDYGNGFTLLFNQTKKKSQVVSFVFKKIVDIRKIFCALSILHLILYTLGARDVSSAVSGISGTQGRYSMKFALNNENKMYILKEN